MALLINREHQSVLGWVDVEPDDVSDLLHELRVVGELEGLHPVRLQAVLAPDAMDRGRRQAARLGHGAQCPVRRRRWVLV
jgi:hypothetical protein